MTAKSSIETLNSCSGNRKSKIQNRKLVGIIALVITFAIGGVEARAQQPKKVPRIGYLSATDAASESIRSEAFRAALRELGYIEGQSIVSNPDMLRRSAIDTLTLR